MEKLPKWKKFLLIASALIVAIGGMYDAYMRMINA